MSSRFKLLNASGPFVTVQEPLLLLRTQKESTFIDQSRVPERQIDGRTSDKGNYNIPT